MNELAIKKMAVFFGLFSFALLLFGSLWMGSRLGTALLRGMGASFFFGLLAWGVGSLLMVGDNHPPSSLLEHNDAGPQGEDLDDTV